MNRSQERIFFQKPFTIVAPPEQLVQSLPDFRIIESLVDLYVQESKRKNFPRFMCVSVVGKALGLHLGLRMEDGKFHIDRPARRAKIKQDELQTWLKDEEGRYYELTGEQFNPAIDAKFSPGVTVIYPGTELYQRYITREQLSQQTLEKYRDQIRM